MEQMLVEELDSDINAVRDKMRETDDKIVTLSGRVPRHQRISYEHIEEADALNDVDRSSFGLEDRRTIGFNDRKSSLNREYQRDSTGGAIKRRIQIEDRIERKRPADQFNRQRVDYLEENEEYDDSSKRPKKSVQSTVIMPALDSKGRDEKIEKLKETENKEVKNRNRRMFSNLLMGTLTNFKKTERKTQQQEKQEAVEKKLEDDKKKDEEKRNHEKHELIQKRRGQEKELYQLQRKKALIQYADIKINQLKMQRGSIKTACSPNIFWQPVRHTIRSMEMLQATEKSIDELIKIREDQLKQDLEAREQRGEVDGNEGEDEYEDENENEEKIEVVVSSTTRSSRDVRIEEDGHTEVKVEMEEDEDVHVELE